MIKWRKLKDERGAAEAVETAFMYPVVFMIIFFLFYVGFYILQQSMLDSYAQKVATIAAREIAYPGYLNLSGADSYKNGAVELNMSVREVTEADGSTLTIAPRAVSCSFDTDTVKADAYRYWRVSSGGRGPLSSTAQASLVGILTDENGLVTKYGFLGGESTEATVTCDNYVISQTVTVEIVQDLMDFGVLEFFNIDTPQAGAIAKATVGDSDEMIRNTDFVIQVVETLANKLGLDVDHMKSTVHEALVKVGILDEDE